jgi:hypothetical protein
LLGRVAGEEGVDWGDGWGFGGGGGWADVEL